MLKVIFVRHGATYGNTLQRYIGITDENLLPESVELLKKKNYPKADKVYVSPLKRTVETAQIIYPNVKPIKTEGLKECNFGIFENKNYKELESSAEYAQWIASGGTMPFPKGESRKDFEKRCVAAFKQIVQENAEKNITIAIVCHGGTIMALMSKLAQPKKDFYQWHVVNGGGYIAAVTQDYTIKVESVI